MEILNINEFIVEDTKRYKSEIIKGNHVIKSVRDSHTKDLQKYYNIDINGDNNKEYTNVTKSLLIRKSGPSWTITFDDSKNDKVSLFNILNILNK